MLTESTAGYLILGTLFFAGAAWMSFDSVWHSALFGGGYAISYVAIEAGMVHICELIKAKPPSSRQ